MIRDWPLLRRWAGERKKSICMLLTSVWPAQLSRAQVGGGPRKLSMLSCATSAGGADVMGPDLTPSPVDPSASDTEVRSPWAEIVGPCYTVASFARATGLTEERVREAAAELSVLALTTADGVALLPSFQVRDGVVVPQLRPLLEVLRRGLDDPWTWAQWLFSEMEGEARHVDDLWAGEFDRTMREAKRTAWAWAQ